MKISFRNTVIEQSLNLLEGEFGLHSRGKVSQSPRYINHIGFEGETSIYLCLGSLGGDNTLELSQGKALLPDHITYGLEGQLHDILDILPVIASREKVLDDRGRVRIHHHVLLMLHAAVQVHVRLDLKR